MRTGLDPMTRGLARHPYRTQRDRESCLLATIKHLSEAEPPTASQDERPSDSVRE